MIADEYAEDMELARGEGLAEQRVDLGVEEMETGDAGVGDVDKVDAEFLCFGVGGEALRLVVFSLLD